MTQTAQSVRIGAAVPDFKLDYFDPSAGDFGSISLEAVKASGKWTILFFYPADFTFV